jgi:hypothetical protein
LSIILQKVARIEKKFDFSLRGISQRWFDVPLEAIIHKARKAGSS